MSHHHTKGKVCQHRLTEEQKTLVFMKSVTFKVTYLSTNWRNFFNPLQIKGVLPSAKTSIGTLFLAFFKPFSVTQNVSY